MKLNVKYKKPKKSIGSTSKTKKKSSKNTKAVKLKSDYKDDSIVDIDNIELDLTQMKYGTITSCDVDRIITTDGVIEVQHSWLEVMLIMISTVIANYPDTFRESFEQNNVTNEFVIVDNVYGKYSFEKAQYKAYKIPNTMYYLEYIDYSGYIFNTIVGLTKCLGIAFNQIKFHLNNKIYSDKLNFTTLEEYEEIVGLNKVAEKLKPGIHMVSVNILGEIVQAHRIDVALVAICNKLYDEYGAFRLTTLPSNESTGIKLLEDGDELNKNIIKIRDSEIGVYCDGDNEGIVKFLRESAMSLDLKDEQIQFKFRSLKDRKEIKEYEVD